MGVDRLRVLLLALVALGLTVAAAWLLDWLVLVVAGRELVAIDLGNVSCVDAEVCGTVSVAIGETMFGKFGSATRWITVLLDALLVFQVGARLVTGVAAPQALTRIGYLLAGGAILSTVFTAYLFQPEIPFYGPISIDRTWAPVMLMAGAVFAMVTLFYAAQTETDLAIAAPPPLDPRLAPARVVPPRRSPPEPVSESIPLDTTPVATPPSPPSVPPTVPAGRPATRTRPPTAPPPELLRGKLRYAAATAELTRAGIDARREDGKTVLVMWRDVVGVVARRLPAEYEGATFVDVVSTAGSTLRVLPWTRLTGDVATALDGADDVRAHAFVQVVVQQCPDVHIDRATREFVERTAPAAQLPDPATLTAHDERLA